MTGAREEHHTTARVLVEALPYIRRFAGKTVVVLAALDNLTKGASGGALQAANVALGLDEALGLPLVGVAP